MKRREFIGITATGAAGLVLPARGGDRAIERGSTLAAPRLLAVVHDPRIVAKIGRHYRELAPAEDDGSTLAKAILADLDPLSAGSLESRLHDRIRHDFAGGRTVTLHGWVVALTEARQCALYSLMPP